MSSQAVHPSLVLTRRLADGTIELIPLAIPQHEPAAAGGAYALIDRGTGFTAPPLVARRVGEDLVVEVDATEVLVLDGFFATANVAFYPNPDIASGGGPFSGLPLGPEAAVLADSSEGTQVVWAAEPISDELSDEKDAPEGDGERGGGNKALLWGGIGLGAAALGAAAGGGGGGGSSGGSPVAAGDSGSPAGGGNPPDTAAPQITSGATAGPIDENSGAGQVVYRAAATDAGSVTFSLEGADAASFTIDADIGEVIFSDNPDFETQSSYSFTVVATDAAGNSSERTVTLAINDIDDVAPKITSGAIAEAIDENSGTGQVVYSADADSAVTWSLLAGGDAADFTINASNGTVRLTENPDQETQPDYNFTVVATDPTGNSSQQAVTLDINDLDEVAPTITSLGTASAIDENSGAGQVVYAVTSTDTGDISTGSTTYSLRPGNDAADFSINASSGAVTLIDNPDFETQSSYNFTVAATDAAGNSSERTVALAINDIDDVAPKITSGAIAEAIDENSGTGQVVYIADADSAVTWSLLAGGDAADFTINAGNGTVRLTENPDQETQPDYNFTVVATDPAGNSSQQAVSLDINDLDEVAPTITSLGTASAIDENSGAGQVVYSITSTDTGDISTGSTTYSLRPGNDAADFSINASSGAVTLIDNPDFETQSSYNFTVAATDAAGNSSERTVALAVNDIDDVAPKITSGAIAEAIDENSGTGQVVYIADADSAVTWSLLAGGDAVDFTINAGNGTVRLTENPDQETQPDYNFTVVATDPAGNSSQQAVTLDINDLDEVAPTITSLGTASAIDENSGAGQVVYAVTSTDTGDISTGSTTYSLRPGNDAADFSINASSGAVTLIDNPDFETQSSYNFTVAATDAAGNSSERTVALAINNVDENQPTVTSVALTSATGAQNNTLNAGDTVRVTVTMSENVTVDIAGGTPRIALNIGGSIAFADFVSGSGTSSLNFTYVVRPGDTDNNGISIVSNALQAGGGSLTDAAGNAANLNHAAVPDNAAFLVDTTAPALTSSSPVDGATATAVTDNIELTFSESVQAGSGNITISDGSDIRVIDVADATQVSISGNRVTINPTADLNPDSSYNVQIESGALRDAAGNDYAGINNSTTLNFETESGVDTSIVVFDLVQGSSSDHSGRRFDQDVSYDIYIRVDSNDATLSTAGGGPGTWGRWRDSDNLGSDDRIILVGNGAPVDGPLGSVTQVLVDDADVSWQTAAGDPAAVVQERSVARFGPLSSSVARLFDRDLPQEFLDGQEGVFNTMYFTTMPAGILTSQGLG